jgi:hypothetical protein
MGRLQMLGDKIGSLTANAVNKALPPVNGMITIETQATGSGTLAGAEVNTLAYLFRYNAG